MADGKNNPNSTSGRFNQIGAAASMDEIFARAQRDSEVNTVAAARLRQHGIAERRKIRGLQESRNLFEQALQSDPNNEGLQAAIAQNRDEYSTAVERRRQIAERFYEEKQFAAIRSQNTLQSQIQTYTGARAQASRINEVYGSSAAVEAAARVTSKTSYTAFEVQATEASRKSREIAVGLREAAAHGAPQEELRRLGGELNQAEQQIGVARRGMTMARKMGLDPESQFERINKISIKASDRIENREITQRMQGAGLGDIKQLQTAINETARELQELSESFKDGKIGLEEFNEKAGAAADKLEKLEKEEFASRASFSDRMGAARSAIGAGMSVINAAQTALIDAPIESLRNRAAIAGRQNEQYATLKAAMHGDMSAFTLLESGAFKDASNFADMMRDRQIGVQGARTTAIAVDKGIDIAQDIAESATIVKAGGGNVAAGIRTGAKIVSGVAEVAQNVADMAYEVTSGRTYLNAYDTALDTYKQVNAVPSQFRQAYRDYTGNAVQAGRFAGARREQMAGELDSDEFIEKMKNLRIDPNRAMEFVGQGVQQQGSVFNTNQLGVARNLERAGFGSMEETMRRLGGLANAGAQNPTEALGSVMEEAVSRGMDSSKAVSMMVDATSQLANNTVARTGVDATSAISQLIGAGIGQRGDRNEAAAMAATMSATQSVNGVLQDKSVNWGNMIRQSRMMQMGMSATEAAVATDMSAEELAVLNRATRKGATEQDMNKAQELTNRRGLGALQDESGNFDIKKTSQFLNIQKEFAQSGGGALTGALFDPATQTASKKVHELRAQGVSEEEIKKRVGKEAYMASQQIIGLATGGANTFEQSRITESFIEQGPITQNRSGGIMNGTTAVGGKTAAGEQIVTQGSQIAAEEVRAGKKGLGSGVEEFSKKMTALEKLINPETMEKFATAAKDAADNMDNSTVNLGNLGESAEKLTSKFDALNKAVDNSVTFLNNKLESLKKYVPDSMRSAPSIPNREKSRPDGKRQ